MSKKNCDIIKDLLPSYVDGICSEASKLWIEEHLAECEACRQTMQLLKNTEISARKLELAQLDAGKKVKKKQLKHSILNLGLCLCIAILMVLVFAKQSDMVSQMVLYVALPICMLVTWLTNKGRQVKRLWDKWDTVSLAAVVVATIYGMGLLLYVTLEALAGKEVFSMVVNEVGPFLHTQLIVVSIVCLGGYVSQMVRLYQKGSVNSIILSLCLMGIFLMLAYRVLMGSLSEEAVVVLQLKQISFTVLGVGLVGTGVFAVIDKMKK